MNGRKKAVSTSTKTEIKVPDIVIDKRNGRTYKKGEFLGKVSVTLANNQQVNPTYLITRILYSL